MTEPRPRCTDRCRRMSEAGLCDWCTRRAGNELASLPELRQALEDALEPSAGRGDGRGSGEPALVCRADVLSFLGPAGDPSASAGTLRPGTAVDQGGPTPLLAVLVEHARRAAEEFGYATRGWTFAVTRKWLAVHHDRICRLPWADDYAAELHEAWCTAMTLTGKFDKTYTLPVPCPTCQDEAAEAYEAGHVDEDGRDAWIEAGVLTRENGAAVVSCRQCLRSWREDEYRTLVLVLAAQVKAGAA